MLYLLQQFTRQKAIDIEDSDLRHFHVEQAWMNDRPSLKSNTRFNPKQPCAKALCARLKDLNRIAKARADPYHSNLSEYCANST
ncbi:hypothetical protein [Paenibacillus alginolyticus]|uniref:hypothetical protein n=1 Tax=Paenibacillus alginolyticus TaxID=59839 RepID=UPI002DBD4FAE|nr:hypothetical protein [Paenibacillus alginolyticus]MEC0144876.1 hypothetical protein [Paenibacillus alginolyticus]